MKKSTLTSILFFCMASVIMNTSCDDNNSFQKKNKVELSTTEVTAQVDDEFSVDINLIDKANIQSIQVTKTRNGKEAEDFTPIVLNVSNMQFPYTFKDMVNIEDEEGIVVYSFSGLDANNKQIDATDLLVKIEFVDLKRLLKFDWLQKSYMENGIEMITGDYAEFADDVYRYNEDYSWQCDWGENAFLGTLVSNCAWKSIGTYERIDSLYTIKYGLSSSWTWEKEITKYEVVEFNKKELILKTINGKGIEIREVFSAIPKSSSFTPYRGANPSGYYVADCKPGSY